jgi:hypothetical protein
MSGTLLHEIIHDSGSANFDLTDIQIAAKLGVAITVSPTTGKRTDTSNISKKLANDCFPTGIRR